MLSVDHRKFLAHFLPVEQVLRYYLCAATGSALEAEDLLQETAGILWEQFGEYDDRRPFRAWAIGVARNKALQWRQLRSRRRLSFSPETLEALASAAEQCEPEARARRAHLDRCLEKLGGMARQILALRYGEALAVAGIAARVGKSVAAVEMMLVRLRRSLRDCMDRAGGDPEGVGS